MLTSILWLETMFAAALIIHLTHVASIHKICTTMPNLKSSEGWNFTKWY
jgi:hypothetical protein